MGKEKDNVIKRKSRDLAIDIINLYKWLCEIQHEYVMSKQLLRAGTSIGANVAEGVRGQTLLLCQDEHCSKRSKRNQLLARYTSCYRVSA